MNGSDYTLYLVFLRYVSYLCAVLAIFDVCLFIPLYWTGTTAFNTEKDWSSMNVLTFMNITANPYRQIFVYIFTLFVEAALAFTCLYLYRQKYESFKTTVDPSADDMDDITIAQFALFVENLPTNVGVEEMQRAISSKMQILYPPDESGKSPFVKARVVGDYNSLYRKCV